MKATQFLKQDHEKVKELFRKFEDTKNGADKMQLFHQIQDELTIHTEIEEQTLYPALRQLGTEKAEELVEEAEEEHGEVKFLLKEIGRLSPEDSEFVLNMGKLIQGVEHHIKEEEESIFPMMERRLGNSKLEKMGERMEELKHTMARGNSE